MKRISIRGKLVTVALAATILLAGVTWLRQQALAGIDRQIVDTGLAIADYNAGLLECQAVLVEDASGSLTAEERRRRLEAALDRMGHLRDETLQTLVAAYVESPSPKRAQEITARITELGRSEAGDLVQGLTVQSRETVLLSQGTVVLSAFAFLTAVLVSVSVGTNLVRRVQALNLAAERVGKGETDDDGRAIVVPVLAKGGDELDHLARQFNEMARQLHLRAAELTQAWHRAEEASAAKTKMLHWVSHELRTPLTVVKGLAEWLIDEEDGPLNGEQQQSAHKILSNSRTLEHLIDELLDLSRIESGKVSVSPEPVDLGEIMAEVTDAVGSLAESEVMIGIRVDDELPRVMADPDRLKQVLTNLVSNALKFTKEGSVTVVARADPDRDGWVRVSVVDTGPGIAPEHQEPIFEAFRQVPGTKGGTGLGLSISRQLVRLHGSDLKLSSELGRGSEFYFSLPMAGEEETAEEMTVDEGRKKLLVIDDEPQVAEMMSRFLRDDGWRIIRCLGPDEAVYLAAQHRPEAITLDIILDSPEDGWAVLRALKDEPTTACIPIIICSVSGEDTGSRDEAAAYLQKPFSAEQLLDVLAKVAG